MLVRVIGKRVQDSVLDMVVHPASSVSLTTAADVRDRDRWPNLAVLGLALVAFGLFSVWAGQDNNFDLRNYHIYNGYAFLTGRWGHDIGPAQLQTFFNPLLHSFSYFLLSHLPPRVYAFVMGSIQGLNFWLVFALTGAIMNGLVPWQRFVLSLSCAAAGTYGFVGVSELGTSMHDLTTAVLVLSAVLLYVRAQFDPGMEPGPRRTHVLVAGFAIGFGVGLKYTVAVYAVGFGTAVLAEGGLLRRRLWDATIWAAGACAGFALAAGHWLVRLYKAFGNPFFPHYNSIFQSPYAEPADFADDRWVPKTAEHFLHFPFLLTLEHGASGELPFTDLRFAILAVLGVVALVAVVARRVTASAAADAVSLKRPGVARWLLVFFVVSYLLWLRKFAIYRYAAGLELVAPIVTCLLLNSIASERRHFLGTCAFVFAIGAATLEAPNWGRAPYGKRYVEIDVPRIERPDKAVVLMHSSEPIAYAIPEFPPEVQFIRVQSNFFLSSMPTKLAEEVRERLRSSELDYYLLTTTETMQDAPEVLSIHELEIVKDSCARMKSNLVDDLVFCSLEKRPAR